MIENKIVKIRPFWPFMTSGGQTVDLRSNLRTHYGKVCKRAIKCCFFPRPPNPYSSRATASFVGKCRTHTVKFDLWWPLVTSFFTLAKKMTEIPSCRPSPKLSNAVCRFSLRWLVFEISVGGCHPPSPRRCEVGPAPVGARVKAWLKMQK